MPATAAIGKKTKKRMTGRRTFSHFRIFDGKSTRLPDARVGNLIGPMPEGGVEKIVR